MKRYRETTLIVLGVAAHKGRTFSAEKISCRAEIRGSSRLRSLAETIQFDPELVGKTITLNEQPLTVIGIAPPQYTGMIRGLGIDVWIPTMMMPAMSRVAGDAMVS